MIKHGRKKGTGTKRSLLGKCTGILLIGVFLCSILGLQIQSSTTTLNADNIVSASQKETLWDQFLSFATSVVFGVDIRQPNKIIQSQLLYDPAIWIPQNGEEDEILFGQTEKIADEIQIQIEQIIKNPGTQVQEPVVNKKNLRILIYHTHNDEAFLKQDGMVYKEATQGRTYNNEYNVVKVGSVLTQTLQELGYTVVHDTTDHVSLGFYTAYNRSLKTIQAQLKTGCFDLVIDLHRDAYYGSAKKFNTVEVNGQNAARMMFVIGTGEGDENTSFTVKPDWKTNLKTAQNLTNALNGFNEQLCKKVNVKTGRYNQHLSAPSVLIEMGNDQNTLSQVEYSAELLAQAIDIVFTTKA